MMKRNFLLRVEKIVVNGFYKQRKFGVVAGWFDVKIEVIYPKHQSHQVFKGISFSDWQNH